MPWPGRQGQRSLCCRSVHYIVVVFQLTQFYRFLQDTFCLEIWICKQHKHPLLVAQVLSLSRQSCGSLDWPWCSHSCERLGRAAVPGRTVLEGEVPASPGRPQRRWELRQRIHVCFSCLHLLAEPRGKSTGNSSDHHSLFLQAARSLPSASSSFPALRTITPFCQLHGFI